MVANDDVLIVMMPFVRDVDSRLLPLKDDARVEEYISLFDQRPDAAGAPGFFERCFAHTPGQIKNNFGCF